MTWLHELFKRADHASLKLVKAEASRAIYNGEDLKEHIELRVVLDTGEKLTFELSPKLAKQVIDQLASSYNAIHPPIKPDLRGTW